MTFRAQTLLVLTVILVIALAALYVGAGEIVGSSTAVFERKTAAAELTRVQRALDNHLEQLDMLLHDWSSWDDTYNFIANYNAAYIESNLIDETFRNLDLDVIVFLDSAGNIVYGGAYDWENERIESLPPALESQLGPASPLFQHTSPETPQNGLLTFSDKVLMLSARSILPSADEGRSRGVLIFGRVLDAAQVAALARVAALDMEMLPWADADAQAWLSRYPALGTDAPADVIEIADEQNMFGLVRLDDLEGKPALLARVNMPRDAYQAARATMKYGFLALAVIGVVSMVMVLVATERRVLRPLAALTSQVHQIGARRDFGARVHIHAHPELKDTADSINAMLAALEASRSELAAEQSRYRAIVQDQTDWIIRFHPDGELTFANEAFCRAFALGHEGWRGVNWFALLPADAVRELQATCVALSEHPVQIRELRLAPVGEMVMWQVWILRAILSSHRQIVEIQGVGQDVTERMEAEQQLYYLSTHDAPTGLYNRAYFETQLERFSKDGHQPVSLVIADVDELKLTNDQYGHAAGDELLCVAAKILGESFRKQDIVARLGGDEFAVLLPNTDEAAAAATLQRVKARLHAHNAAADNPTLGLSIGWATAKESVSLQDALLLADKRMYQEKFARRPAARVEHALGVKASQEILSQLATQGMNAAAADNLFAASRAVHLEQALQESEEKYRALLELLPVITYVMQLEQVEVVLYVSQQVEALFGGALSEWLAQPDAWARRIHPDDYARIMSRKRECLARGEPFDAEYRMLNCEDKTIWIHDRARVIRLEKNSLLHGVAIEITARKLAEAQLAQQFQELEGLYTLTATMNRGESLDEIFSAALRALVTTLRVDHAAILLYDAQGVMRFRAWQQLSDEYRSRAEGHSPWARDAVNPAPLLVPDAMEEPSLQALRATILREGIRALAFIPLVQDGELLGKFMLYYDTVHAWATEEVQLARAIANQTAIAIARTHDRAALAKANSQLESIFALIARNLTARQRAEELNAAFRALAEQLSAAETKQEAAQIVAQVADQIIGWDAFLLALYSHAADRISEVVLTVDVINGTRARVEVIPETKPTPLMRRALEENGVLVLRQDLEREARNTIHFGDTARPSASLMFMPIWHQEQAIGLLSLQSYHWNAYDETAFTTLRALAEQCGTTFARLAAQDDLRAQNRELESAYDATIAEWAHALELRDSGAQGQIQRVVEFTLALAQRLGVAESEWKHLKRGALLHDIGKVAVPDEILCKQGALTDAEWKTMRLHPVYACEMLKNIEYLKPALDIPHCHHEWWDGSGYPRGLKGQAIPLAARIFAVVDVWDALSSDRSYRSRWTAPDVYEYLQSHAGKQFDPQVVQVFLELLAEKEWT